MDLDGRRDAGEVFCSHDRDASFTARVDACSGRWRPGSSRLRGPQVPSAF